MADIEYQATDRRKGLPFAASIRAITPTITSILVITGLLWAVARPFVEDFIVQTVTAKQFVGSLSLAAANLRIDELEAHVKALEAEKRIIDNRVSANRDNLRLLIFQQGGFGAFNTPNSLMLPPSDLLTETDSAPAEPRMSPVVPNGFGLGL